MRMPEMTLRKPGSHLTTRRLAVPGTPMGKERSVGSHLGKGSGFEDSQEERC